MKKIGFLFLCFLFVLTFALPCFASPSSSGFYVDGFYTLEKSGFPNTPLYNPLSTPVVDSSFAPPSGYSLIGYYMDTGLNTPSFPYTVEYIYSDASKTWSFYSTSSAITLTASNTNIYYVVNSISSDGVQTFTRYRTQGATLTTGRLARITVFIDTYDNNGNINRPQNQVIFTMNTAIVGYNLAFNSQINSGDATSVEYYIFPSSTSIVSGSTTSIVPLSPSSELSQAEQESFLSRGFKILTYGLDDFLNDVSSPQVALSSSSSARSSSVFDPDSFGVSYEKLGVSRLFPSDSGGGISTSGSLSLKDMISLHTGVYAYSSLKLVGVVTTADTSFVATFDFNPSLIVGGSPVPPSSVQGSVNFPTFSNGNSDFKELADYLKDLFNTNQENMNRNNNNLIAMLGAMPWSEYVGTGFGSQLPQLSMYLDSLFTDLFDNLTTPSQEDIDALYADIQEEKADLKSKLAFVTDVKTEMYFIISTITADNNTVPPNFQVTLPSVLFGGQSSVTVNILSYELATPYIVGIIKDIITVFLSLSLVVYVWKTLPSTIGNMPRGDD